MDIKIHTKNINVKEVKKNDLIKSYYIYDKTTIFQNVDYIYENEILEKDRYTIYFENNDILDVSLTTQLLIYSNDKLEYLQVKDLLNRDNLYMYNNELNKIKIEKIIQSKYQNSMYIDFNIHHTHNFFVKKPNNQYSYVIHNSGSVTVALDVWHADIENFLEMQKENADPRKQAFDVFPQVVIPNEFMERVEKNDKWFLFDPYEIKKKFNIDLVMIYGKEFNKNYNKIVKKVLNLCTQYDLDINQIEIEDFPNHYKEIIKKDKNVENIEIVKVIDAKTLLKEIMITQIETGLPYLFFKDNVNEVNPLSHDGIIPSGNLCVESFSNVKPTEIDKPYLDKNGDIVRHVRNGLTHTCNLVSINLANTQDEELEDVCATAVRILDNTIDITKTPIIESTLHNERYRTIGVGFMGLADYIVSKNQTYEKSHDLVNELFEKTAFYCYKASNELAIERGAFLAFEGSKYSQGILLNKDKEWFLKNSTLKEKWIPLIDSIIKNGLRNGLITAIAPNTSSSLIQGCSASVMPIFNKFYVDMNAKGTPPIMPPFIKDKLWYYKEMKHMDMRVVAEIIAIIQNWIDTGISFELMLNPNLEFVDAPYFYELIMKIWKLKCKAIYYVRSIQKNNNGEDIMNEKDECVSCAG